MARYLIGGVTHSACTPAHTNGEQAFQRLLIPYTPSGTTFYLTCNKLWLWWYSVFTHYLFQPYAIMVIPLDGVLCVYAI